MLKFVDVEGSRSQEPLLSQTTTFTSATALGWQASLGWYTAPNIPTGVGQK
jgi:hypothetical protein